MQRLSRETLQRLCGAPAHVVCTAVHMTVYLQAQGGRHPNWVSLAVTGGGAAHQDDEAEGTDATQNGHHGVDHCNSNVQNVHIPAAHPDGQCDTGLSAVDSHEQ